MESRGMTGSTCKLIENKLTNSDKIVEIKYKTRNCPIGYWGGWVGEVVIKCITSLTFVVLMVILI